MGSKRSKILLASDCEVWEKRIFASLKKEYDVVRGPRAPGHARMRAREEKPLLVLLEVSATAHVESLGHWMGCFAEEGFPPPVVLVISPTVQEKLEHCTTLVGELGVRDVVVTNDNTREEMARRLLSHIAQVEASEASEHIVY